MACRVDTVDDAHGGVAGMCGHYIYIGVEDGREREVGSGVDRDGARGLAVAPTHQVEARVGVGGEGDGGEVVDAAGAEGGAPGVVVADGVDGVLVVVVVGIGDDGTYDGVDGKEGVGADGVFVDIAPVGEVVAVVGERTEGDRGEVLDSGGSHDGAHLGFACGGGDGEDGGVKRGHEHGVAGDHHATRVVGVAIVPTEELEACGGSDGDDGGVEVVVATAARAGAAAVLTGRQHDADGVDVGGEVRKEVAVAKHGEDIGIVGADDVAAGIGPVVEVVAFVFNGCQGVDGELPQSSRLTVDRAHAGIGTFRIDSVVVNDVDKHGIDVGIVGVIAIVVDGNALGIGGQYGMVECLAGRGVVFVGPNKVVGVGGPSGGITEPQMVAASLGVVLDGGSHLRLAGEQGREGILVVVGGGIVGGETQVFPSFNVILVNLYWVLFVRIHRDGTPAGEDGIVVLETGDERKSDRGAPGEER